MANPQVRDWQGRTLPNRGSPVQTQASLQIDVHYALLFKKQPWTWDRFNRLCRFLTLTPAELASFVRMPHSGLARFEREIRIMGDGAGAYELLLTFLEAHVYRGMAGSCAANPFPDLSKFDGLSKNTGREGMQPGAPAGDIHSSGGPGDSGAGVDGSRRTAEAGEER